MKVLFVSNLFPSQDEPVRGLDNACLLDHLTRKGTKIRALGIRPSLQPQKWRKTSYWKPRPEDQPFHPVYTGVPYIPKIGSHWNHRLIAKTLGKTFQKALRTFQPDVVLCSWLYPDGCAVTDLAKENGIPSALICQGSDAHSYLGNPVRKRLIIGATRRSRAIITRSADLARQLREAGVEDTKLHPIYNGVDLGVFHPGDRRQTRRDLGLEPEGALILFVGNFLPVKNPLLLIRALKDIHNETGTKLVLIGEGPLETGIRAVVQSSGLGTAVTFAGQLPAEDVAQYMRAADVLCLPSWNEGVPNVVLEAFASGLPVVSSDVGGIHEVLDRPELGTLVPAGDCTALTKALQNTISAAPPTSTISNHSQKFSWETTAENYLKVLNETRQT